MKKASLFVILLVCIAVALLSWPVDIAVRPGAKPRPEPTNTAAEDWDWEAQATSYRGPLPWDESPSVQAFLAERGAPVLMAAFKAVLREPIGAEPYNIALAAEKLSGTVILPGAIFSQNQTIGPYTEDRGYRAGPTYMGNRYTTTIGGGVCKVSSLLYNVVLLSNLRVVERHPHSMTVPYVPPGQDATVYYGVRDFKFQNTTTGPVVILAKFKDNTLYMALYGTEKPPEVRWHHAVLKRVPTWTEEHFNPQLPPGEKRVVMKGQEGIVVRSWLTIKTPTGKAIKKELGTDWYEPSPRIVEFGPRKNSR